MVSPFLRPVGLVAGWSALVQSVAWWILSLLGILAYFDSISLDTEIQPRNRFSIQLACTYFYDVSVYQSTCKDLYCTDDNRMTTNDVVIIMGFYFASSSVWFCITIMLLINMHKKEWKYTKIILYVWATITSAISFLDLVVTICFGVDFERYSNHDCGDFLSVPATMMSLAARGYVLWVLNVAAVIYLFRVSHRFDSTDEDEARSSQRSSIISTLYRDPVDSIPHRNMGYQNTEYATPERDPGFGGNNLSIQSPHVGENLRDNPWSFPMPGRDQKPLALSRNQPPASWDPQPPQRDYPAPTRDYQTPVRDNQPSAWDQRQPPAWEHQAPGRGYQPPRALPVRTPQVPPLQGPPPSYIPDPDYDDYEDGDRNPSRQRKKYEPRPFDEIPRRSALKKQRSADYLGRTAF